MPEISPAPRKSIMFAPGARATRTFRGFLAGIALMGCAGAATPTSLDLTPHRGHVVIVDFWASWCKPCRESIPWLNRMRERFGDEGLVIIGVNVDAERADAERFMRAVPISFDVVFDAQGSIATQFGVQAMPSTFVFDRNGKLAQTHLGFREARREQTERDLQALLSAEATGKEPKR